MSPLAIRAIIYLAIAGIVAGILWGGYSHVKGIGAEEVRTTLQPQIDTLTVDLATAQASLKTEREAAKQTREVSSALQTDLNTIRADRDRLRDLPPRIVRVRVPVPAAAVEGARPAAAGQSGSTAAGTLALEGAGGRGTGLDWDLGPFLYRLADDGDERESELAAQVRRLQEAYAVAERVCQ